MGNTGESESMASMNCDSVLYRNGKQPYEFLGVGWGDVAANYLTKLGVKFRLRVGGCRLDQLP